MSAGTSPRPILPQACALYSNRHSWLQLHPEFHLLRSVRTPKAQALKLRAYASHTVPIAERDRQGRPCPSSRSSSPRQSIRAAADAAPQAPDALFLGPALGLGSGHTGHAGGGSHRARHAGTAQALARQRFYGWLASAVDGTGVSDRPVRHSRPGPVHGTVRPGTHHQ